MSEAVTSLAVLDTVNDILPLRNSVCLGVPCLPETNVKQVVAFQATVLGLVLQHVGDFAMAHAQSCVEEGNHFCNGSQDPLLNAIVLSKVPQN